MAQKDEFRRWRDQYPQLFAAWLVTRTAAQRTSRWWHQSAAAPSAWTTALMAGGLAVLLSVALLFIPPPQPASINTSSPQGLLDTRTAAESPVTLELGVERMAPLDADWEEQSTEEWTSITPEDATPLFAAAADDWTVASPREEAQGTAPEPYYLRAEFIAFEQFTAATTAQDVPAPVAEPEIDRTVSVVLERSPAAADDSGALAYTLNVRNQDVNPVAHVRVIETLPLADYVLETSPAALMTPDGALVWQLADLQPFESRTLTVTLDGSQVTAPLQTIAALDVETQVSVKSQVFPLPLNETPPEEPIQPELVLQEPEPEPQPEPEPGEPPPFEPIDPVLADEPAPVPQNGWNPFGGPAAPAEFEPITPELTGEAPVVLPEQFEPNEPPLSDPFPSNFSGEPAQPAPEPRPSPLPSAHPPRPILSVQANARNAVRTGEVLTTEYQIRNDGDAPAEGIVLTVFVPPELRHKHGEQVEHKIERLLPGQTHSARLLTKAASAGTAELDAVLSYDGQPKDEHKLTVRVVGSRTATPPAQPRPR